MPLFGPKRAIIRRFEFTDNLRSMKPDLRVANALEHIAYSLGRIEQIVTTKWGEPPVPEEPKADE